MQATQAPIEEGKEQQKPTQWQNRHVKQNGHEERLLERLRSWLELGMPTAACLDLKVYPVDTPLEAGEHQWVVKRRDSQFLWSLQG